MGGRCGKTMSIAQRGRTVETSPVEKLSVWQSWRRMQSFGKNERLSPFISPIAWSLKT